MASPKLNVGKLYESVFANIQEPTAVSIELDSSVLGNPKAREIAGSIKTIVNEASEAINRDVPALVAASAENEEGAAEEGEASEEDGFNSGLD